MAHGDPEPAITALTGLIHEFRHGQIVSSAAERRAVEQHAARLTARWDERFRGFPSRYFPYTSLRGEHYRGRRDAHLRDIIVHSLADRAPDETVIVNPACVFGRHARDLASRLPHSRVIGTDIDPTWNRIYELVRRRNPANYAFLEDDIFDPRLDAKATAVVFFGACGAVSDGAIDYAVDSHAAYLMCRTCCHDNIGGNVRIARRPSLVNFFFRFKNWAHGRMREKAKYAGYYFSDRYTPAAYPRSGAARSVSTSDEFQAVARHSVESDVCRTIIDLDRYLHLVENGYRVWYQGELFMAERNPRTV